MYIFFLYDMANVRNFIGKLYIKDLFKPARWIFQRTKFKVIAPLKVLIKTLNA
jgi:hypothetical protein